MCLSPHADADIIEHLNEFWDIEKVEGLCPEAQEAQEYVAKLPKLFRSLAKRQAKAFSKSPREPREWEWLNGRVL